MKVHRKRLAVFGLTHVVFVSLLVALLSGCASHKSSDASPTPVAVQTARFADLQQHRMIPVNSFSSRERMAAVIRNLTPHDQVLQVEMVRQDSGLTIWKNAVSVPRGQICVTGPTAVLPGGNYAVKVSGTGMQPVTCGFSVYGY